MKNPPQKVTNSKTSSPKVTNLKAPAKDQARKPSSGTASPLRTFGDVAAAVANKKRSVSAPRSGGGLNKDVDLKPAVNSFLKSIKSGVKSGVESAVKVGKKCLLNQGCL